MWRTGSTAMLGSLADTALDLVASLATLTGVWIAAQPADEEHRFGHGKAEALAAMFQVMLIALSAGGDRLARGAAADRGRADRGGGARASSCLAASRSSRRFALLAWQRHVIRRTGSLAIRTDNVHYQSDLLLNLAVIAALALDQYLGFARADPLFGLAIAALAAVGRVARLARGDRPPDGPRMARGEAAALRRAAPRAIPSCASCTTCAPAPAATATSCSSTSTCRRRMTVAEAHDDDRAGRGRPVPRLSRASRC